MNSKTTTAPIDNARAPIARWFPVLGSLAIIVTALILGASLFIPFAIAMLIFVLLTATIDWIAKIEIGGVACPKWLAHVLSFGMIFAGIAGAVLILGRQASEVAIAFPRYEERMAGLLTQILSILGEDNAAMVQQSLTEIDVSGLVLGVLDRASAFVGGLLLVLLYIPFFMAERGPMTRKFPIAVGDAQTADDIRGVAQEIVRGLQLYVGVKTFVSVLTGLFCYVVLKLVGLDFAETWGVLAFALNFIPSIGSILGVVLPAIVALVQFDTIGPFLIVVFGCGLVQFAIGNILEPSITGRRLNLAPIMVILALTIWTTLWGIAGAFLSVPITVCLLIILSHLPSTRPLAVLMSGSGDLGHGTQPTEKVTGHGDKG